MTPEEAAAVIGGEVQEVFEPLQVECPTCGAAPGRKCRKLYDGTVAQPHPRRREGGRGVRVVGPFVARIEGVGQ